MKVATVSEHDRPTNRGPPAEEDGGWRGYHVNHAKGPHRRVCAYRSIVDSFVTLVIAMSSGGKGPMSPSSGPVVRCGHLKKLKTLKKKYFVLRGEAPGCLACLEYYDSKKKFENRQPPKRSILLHSCFNINKRGDTKHKHVIALYTKDECFCLILDSEKELDEWLKAMLRLQSGDVPDGEQPRPTFGKFPGYTPLFPRLPLERRSALHQRSSQRSLSTQRSVFLPVFGPLLLPFRYFPYPAWHRVAWRGVAWRRVAQRRVV